MNYLKPVCVALLLALSACSAGPHLRVTNAIVNLGQGLPDSMLNVHLVASVGFDEDFAGRYNNPTRAVLYVAGVIEGTPEYLYRVVRTNSGNLQGFAWVADGEGLYSTPALVPDSMPRLKAGDIVEFRQTSTWDVLKDFSKTGEGNVVTKILCRKAQPDYTACLEAAPRTGKTRGNGPTGRPFPASVKDYGFTFTPAYDSKGTLLRPLP